MDESSPTSRSAFQHSIPGRASHLLPALGYFAGYVLSSASPLYADDACRKWHATSDALQPPPRAISQTNRDDRGWPSLYVRSDLARRSELTYSLQTGSTRRSMTTLLRGSHNALISIRSVRSSICGSPAGSVFATQSSTCVLPPLSPAQDR